MTVRCRILVDAEVDVSADRDFSEWTLTITDSDGVGLGAVLAPEDLALIESALIKLRERPDIGLAVDVGDAALVKKRSRSKGVLTVRDEEWGERSAELDAANLDSLRREIWRERGRPSGKEGSE